MTAAERILVVGGPGSGKTTFAAQLAQRTGLPLHHLDEVARQGGGRGPERSAAQRDEDVAAITAAPRWIAEGLHLGWTAPLYAAADVIVWLDHISASRSGGRIVRRFASQALAEARRRRGLGRFLRPRDYVRRLRELAVSLPETRSFPSAELEAALAAHDAKLIRCRSAADVAAALERLSA